MNPSSFLVYNASAGSGKTFTLVKEYLKILMGSENPRLYQKVLAITFTNKAANEMKERILENLLVFADKKQSNDMMHILFHELNLNERTGCDRARRILLSILNNYGAFSIRTIDSFVNQLIRAFSFELQLGSDFEVELDVESVMLETVNSVIAQIGPDKDLTKLLLRYARNKTREDRSWDVSRDLADISKLLLNENHIQEIEGLRDRSINDFAELEKTISARIDNRKAEMKKLAQELLEEISQKGLVHKDFQRSQVPNQLLKICSDPVSVDLSEESSIIRNIRKSYYYTQKAPEQVKRSIDDLSDAIETTFLTVQAALPILSEYTLIKKNLTPLAVINSLYKALDQIREDQNIRLNAEFNKIISDHLKNEPAAFIYEKLGERYQYFFIDEMQDTSEMQWQNLIPLIDNSLSSEGGKLLLVGDAKQAIYRWRGGKAEQFIDLYSTETGIGVNPFQVPKDSRQLDTNFRSYSAVIEFNNSFFQHIGGFFHHKVYQQIYEEGNRQLTTAKKGGYVQIDFMEQVSDAEERDAKMCEQLHKLLGSISESFALEEICILTRKRAEGVLIGEFLSQQGIPVVSSETLKLANNKEVKFLVTMIQQLQAPDDLELRFEMALFLYDHLQPDLDRHSFISSLLKDDLKQVADEVNKYGLDFSPGRYDSLSLYDLCESLIREFRLTSASNAYIQFFLDVVFDYSMKRTGRRVDFLSYWEEKKEGLNLVASDEMNGVRIMTIHKSKGLEFPVVIFPFDQPLNKEIKPQVWYQNLDDPIYEGFDSILVDSGKLLEASGDYGKGLKTEREKALQLDNFNLLYVCLTRAREQVYVLSEKKKYASPPSKFSDLFQSYLREIGMYEPGRSTYSFGDKKRLSERPDRGVKPEILPVFVSESLDKHQIYMTTGEAALWESSREEAINFGNLFHEIMSRIEVRSDIHEVLFPYRDKGLIHEEQLKALESLIVEVVEHKDLVTSFSPTVEHFCEREIVDEEGTVLIPDRLSVAEGSAIIVDYKTGEPQASHKMQINRYAEVLEQMGYSIDKKLLVYIDKNVKIVNA